MRSQFGPKKTRVRLYGGPKFRERGFWKYPPVGVLEGFRNWFCHVTAEKIPPFIHGRFGASYAVLSKVPSAMTLHKQACP